MPPLSEAPESQPSQLEFLQNLPAPVLLSLGSPFGLIQAERRSWKEGKLPCSVWLCLEASGKSFQQFLMDPRAGLC